VASSLIAISFIGIAIMFLHARRQLRSYFQKKEPDISSFWMEKVFSKGLVKYAVLSFILSLGVTIVTYLLPILIAGPSPWWLRTEAASTIYQTITSSLLILAIMMGFLVPRQLYHYLVKEVIGDMNRKLNNTL